ncbi:MAG: rod shape-determining protein MreD [Selenomonadaceae bacterium]|nr:rod shape-determining protein MreD [Selenomonadaceae bacterium]MBQ7630609.1 rod shape-determining protein MreD [Selenomonadaceae bacterium]
MKVFALLAVIILVMYSAQTSLLTYLDYNGVSANLMLLVVVSTAFLRGHFFAVLMGLFTGLLQDSTSGDFFGCATFAYMTVGLIFGKFSERVVKEEFLLPVVSAPIAAAIYFFITTGFIHLLGYPLDIVNAIHTTLLPLIFYQIIFSLLVHKIAYEFDKLVRDYYA